MLPAFLKIINISVNSPYYSTTTLLPKQYCLSTTNHYHSNLTYTKHNRKSIQANKHHTSRDFSRSTKTSFKKLLHIYHYVLSRSKLEQKQYGYIIFYLFRKLTHPSITSNHTCTRYNSILYAKHTVSYPLILL